jgi:hypothetical protein
MKVILSVPDEGYSERTWWRLFWAHLMKVILSVPDEGYSRKSLCALNCISTFLCYIKTHGMQEHDTNKHYDEQLVVYTIQIQTYKPRVTKWQNDKIRGKAKHINM